MSLVMAFGSASSLEAQAVVFRGNDTVIAKGFTNLQGTAVDLSGNVYVIDAGSGQLVKIAAGAPADCSTGCSVVAGGFAKPVGVAIAASGYIFVSDTIAGQLVRVSQDGSKTIVGLLQEPKGVAVDSNGDTYVSLAAGSLVRITAAGVESVVTTDLSQPDGVATDAADNLYVTEYGNNRVMKIVPGSNPSPFITGLSGPSSIAIDATGAIYVSDSIDNRLIRLPAGTGPVDCSIACPTLGTELIRPRGISVDPGGDVYLSDAATQAVEIASSVDLGSMNIGGTATSESLIFALPGPDCSLVSTINVLTTGVSSQEFSSPTSGNVCTAGSPTTLNVTVMFRPQFAGSRHGAIQLIDASGALQAVTYIYGIGNGPQISWTPGIKGDVISP